MLTTAVETDLDQLLVARDGTAAAVKQLGQETRSVGRVGESIDKLQLLRGLGAEHMPSARTGGKAARARLRFRSETVAKAGAARWPNAGEGFCGAERGDERLCRLERR